MTEKDMITITFPNGKVEIYEATKVGIDCSSSASTSYIVELDVPSTATQGTLTEAELLMLQSNANNMIMLDHEIYRLFGQGHIEGYLTYCCIEYENNAFNLKCITITVSTRAWVLNKIEIQGE